jgi:hypothetical protein
MKAIVPRASFFWAIHSGGDALDRALRQIPLRRAA